MGLKEIIVQALTDLLRVLFSPISEFIESNAEGLLDLITGTPHPNTVFGHPSTGAWPKLHDYYWESVVPLSLLLLGMIVGVVILLEATGSLFSNYHKRRLKRRALAALFGILSWWWIATLSLQLVSAIVAVILPSLSSISLFETLSFGTMGVLGLVVAMTVDLTLFLLIGAVYFVRVLVLYLFVLLMPLLMVFWVPNAGPLTMVAGFARRLAGFFVPFLIIPIPVAGLFRVSGVLGQSGSSLGTVGLWLSGLIVPLLAVLVPIVMLQQIGSVFHAGRRFTRHASSSRARQRVQSARETLDRMPVDPSTIRGEQGRSGRWTDHLRSRTPNVSLTGGSTASTGRHTQGPVMIENAAASETTSNGDPPSTSANDESPNETALNEFVADQPYTATLADHLDDTQTHRETND